MTGISINDATIIAGTTSLKLAQLKEMQIEELDYFQGHNHFAFSPASSELMTVENAVLLIALMKLSKTPEGLKALRDIVIKYLDSCAKIVESVEAACHSNWLTALNNQQITAAVAHRIGLIDDGAYLGIRNHYRVVFDKMYVFGAIEGLGTLILGGKSEITGAGVGVESKGLPWEQIGAMAAGVGK